MLIFLIWFQLFLQGESDLEESTDEDDELKEINGGNFSRIDFIIWSKEPLTFSFFFDILSFSLSFILDRCSIAIEQQLCPARSFQN